jgi:hypothetical protein
MATKTYINNVIDNRPKWCSGYDYRLLTQRFRVRVPGKVWFFPLKFESFWLVSGSGGQFILTLLSHWRERRIQNKTRVTVIVGVNVANNQLILKKQLWESLGNFRLSLTKYMQHRNFFEYKNKWLWHQKIKPWCTLGPSCGPRAGVLLHPLKIHPSIHVIVNFS